MQLFDTMQPWGPKGPSKSSRKGSNSRKVGNLGVMHKTTIVGALQTLNFGILVFLVLVRLTCLSKLSRSAFFDCEKCKPFMSPILPNHTSPHYTTTQHLRPQIPKNLNRGPFTQTPKGLINWYWWAHRSLVVRQIKKFIKSKEIFLGHLQVLLYTRPPNSQLIFSKPGNGPFFGLLTSP